MQHENHYPSAPLPTLQRGQVSPHNNYNNASYGGALVAPNTSPSAYPSLHDFMGLELTEEMIRANMPEYLEPPRYDGVVAVPQASTSEFYPPYHHPCQVKLCAKCWLMNLKISRMEITFFY